MDIALIGKSKNEGERILLEISSALVGGRQPSKENIQGFSKAVQAMIAESDPTMRLNAFTRALGMENPGGRPSNESNINYSSETFWLAVAYWSRRLEAKKQGESPTRTAQIIASEYGYSDTTVNRKVNEKPKAAEFAFTGWGLDKEEVKKVREEMKKRFENAAKTP